jgi:hypothetical protein
MALIAQNIMDAIEAELQDESNGRWSEAFHLESVNQARRLIACFKPDSYIQNESVALTAGAKQTLPSGALWLGEVLRNMGTTGTAPGNAIRAVDKRVLDDFNPDWTSEDQATSIKHYCYDERDPKNWYCYPPADGNGYVEMIYPAIPDDIGKTDDIVIDDSYQAALIAWGLCRAYRQQKHSGNFGQLAQAKESEFYRLLGLKDKQEIINSPNTPQELRNVAQAQGV